MHVAVWSFGAEKNIKSSMSHADPLWCRVTAVVVVFFLMFCRHNLGHRSRGVHSPPHIGGFEDLAVFCLLSCFFSVSSVISGTALHGRRKGFRFCFANSQGILKGKAKVVIIGFLFLGHLNIRDLAWDIWDVHISRKISGTI